MIIIVTGTPGTGKTTVAKALAKELNHNYLDLNIIIDQFDVVVGYDKKRKSKIIDEDKLVRYMKEIILGNKDLVIDSHLSHYIPPEYVDICFVTKCNLKELKKRLLKRKYSKEKINENLQVEIFDVCLNEAKEMGHKVKIIMTG